MYKDSTVYVVGDAKASTNNPITKQYSSLFVGLVVDLETDSIVDFGCSATIIVTNRFLQSLFIGENILDEPAIIDKMESRYFGSSQKGIIVAYKDALKKYRQIKENTALPDKAKPSI